MFFFSSRRRHTRFKCDWSSDVCSSDLHFDERTRRILVIGTLLALCQWDEFRLHVRAALTEGAFTPDDIKEIILQQALYCGVPAANHALNRTSAIIGELGLLHG